MTALQQTFRDDLGPFVGKEKFVILTGYVENAGDPNGSLIPTHIGQWCFDTTNLDFYVAVGVTNTDWAAAAFPDISPAELNILDGATLSTAELNLLDGSLVANTAASVAAILDAAKALRTNSNVGTAGTNVTAVEYGDGYHHITVLTLTAAVLTPTIPANAEGAGAIIYTFPAGVYVAKSAHMDITAGTMDSATNAADVGLGSLIASGDIVTLTTAAMEDWITGQTVADVSTFVVEKSTVVTGTAGPILFESGESHVLHVNAAATWNATVAAADVTATITIAWDFLGA